MLDWGANNARYTWDGQWWRLVTNKFLALDCLTLVIVGWPLFDAGRAVERVFGRAALLAVYFGATVTTSLAALAFGAPNKIVTGAASPTIALFGTMVAYAAAVRSRTVLEYLRPLRFSGPLFIAFFVWQGLRGLVDVPAVSIGVLTGALLGLTFVPRGDVPGATVRPAQWPIAAVVLVIIAGAVWTQARPPDYLASEARAMQRALQAFERSNNALVDRRRDWEKRAAASPDAAHADELERDHLPQWRRLRAELDAAPDRPGLPAGEYVAPMKRYADAQVRYMEALSKGMRADPPDLKDAEAARRDVDASLAEIRAVTKKREEKR